MAGLRKSQRVSVLAALAVVGATALTGCAESGGSTSSGGDGVDAGATLEEYQKAFEDVDPIELRTQSPAPKGSVTGANVEAYLNAITEWSDGKVTFDVAYSNGVAEPGETDKALVDGRLDIAQVLPIYNPSEYPANNMLIEAGFISNHSPVAGVLQSNAWPNEVAFNTPEIMAEYDDHGMVPLVPIYNSGSNALFCSDKRTGLKDIKGITAASGGTAQSHQIEALGGEATSVPYPELFESLQRGVVDCTISSPTVGVLGGFIEEAPQVVLDEEAGFALAPGGMAFSKTTWDTLPLVVQQLFWDRLDIFIETNLTGKIWPNTVDAVTKAKASGGGFFSFDDDARSALQGANEELLAGLGEKDAIEDAPAFVEDMQTAADSWLAAVGEVGIDDEVGFNDFDTWYDEGKIDVSAFIDKLMADVFEPHRPS
ncbi:TRAP transporter substrate-binding protein DctP [Nocardioides sp. BYT-33-1]|uniref:TRAP transporter substrate-binding protein DctP n=1 Tax=Nocardioides sp. BYT-33-1 TaxID=3416952 RepID=UPI003F5314E8